MELKKFEAPTLAEALQVVKRELGPEAIILSTKNKRGALGLMNRTSVEVTAAVSAGALEKKRLAESRLSEDQRGELLKRPASKVVAAYDVLSGKRLTSQESAARTPTPVPQRQTASAAPLTQRRYIDIQDDESPAEQLLARAGDRAQVRAPQPSVFEQAAMLARQNTVNNLMTRAVPPPAQPQQSVRSSNSPALSNANGGIRQVLPRLLARLVEAGIEDELIKEVGDELRAIMLREHLTQEDLLELQMARILMAKLRVARPLGERLRMPTTPRIIVFVGPTGVGKTTTIAKIAAELVIHQKRAVTLATTDTFKIAAVEQLQTYANILRVPLEVCPNVDALGNLGARLSPDEVVLVDTAGFGPKDDRKIQELSEILGGVRSENHLCVSATTRDRDLKEMVRRFGVFNPDYLVVTKIDETSVYGNVFNIAVRSHLPLSYFTMGQRVPEDIEIATRERVADLLLGIAGGA